jgi:hypothetical protein
VAAKTTSGAANPAVPRTATPRYEFDLPVRYSGRDFEGHGLLCNISSTGASISEPTILVPNGTELCVEFGPLSGSMAVSMRSEVVRETEKGFAVQFIEEESRGHVLLSHLLGIAEAEKGGGRGKS